jgi:hypothetical protein
MNDLDFLRLYYFVKDPTDKILDENESYKAESVQEAIEQLPAEDKVLREWNAKIRPQRLTPPDRRTYKFESCDRTNSR